MITINLSDSVKPIKDNSIDWHGFRTTYNLDCDCVFCNYVKKYHKEGKAGFMGMTFKPHMIVPYDSESHGPHEKYPGQLKKLTKNLHQNYTSFDSMLRSISNPPIFYEMYDEPDPKTFPTTTSDVNPDSSIGAITVNYNNNFIFVCNVKCDCIYCEAYRKYGVFKIEVLSPEMHNEFGHGFFCKETPPETTEKKVHPILLTDECLTRRKTFETGTIIPFSDNKINEEDDPVNHNA